MEHILHETHNIELYDMDKVIECAECHRKVTVGVCYGSYKHFTSNGVWALNVCPACHDKELSIVLAEEKSKKAKEES